MVDWFGRMPGANAEGRPPTHAKGTSEPADTTRIIVREMLAFERRFLETAFGKRLVPDKATKTQGPQGNKVTEFSQSHVGDAKVGA